MKIRPALFLAYTATFAALALVPASAKPSAKPAYVHPVGEVERFGHTIVARGFSVSQVERSLGGPMRKLNDDVWVYTSFRGESGDSAPRLDDDCSTLLITFTAGRVSNLELVNDRAEKIIAARLRARTSDNVQVAAK
jgi:hypothetical protein